MEKLKGLIGKLIIAVVVWVVVGLLLWLLGALFATLFPGILPLFKFGEYLKQYATLIGFLAGLYYFVFGKNS